MSGARTQHKYKVLDKLLQFIPLFWKKKNGDPYEPGSFRLYIKHINAILKGEGVNYSIENEFSNKGEFHAVFNNVLEKNRQNNKNYGEKGQQAFMDPKADEKMVNAIKNMTLKPDTVYTDLIKVVLYCLTRYFCLRGGDELCFALKSHFKLQY